MGCFSKCHQAFIQNISMLGILFPFLSVLQTSWTWSPLVHSYIKSRTQWTKGYEDVLQIKKGSDLEVGHFTGFFAERFYQKENEAIWCNRLVEDAVSLQRWLLHRKDWILYLHNRKPGNSHQEQIIQEVSTSQAKPAFSEVVSSLPLKQTQV